MSLPLHLAIGAFDGVHLGHRAVLHSAREAARADGGVVGVLTYDPHPSKVLRPESAVPLIFTRAQKDARLTEAGAQRIHHQKFDQQHAGIEAADFPRWLKQAFPGLRSLHVGANFQYGRARTGHGETLIAHAAGEALGVKLVPAVRLGEEAVSSSRIRQCLAGGELTLANAMLFRPYEAEGIIIGGRRLGRTLGFPTVNVAWEPELKPAYGVYAVEVVFQGEALPAVANYGLRPTVESGPVTPLLEAHVLRGVAPTTGDAVRIRWIRRLRAEQKFADLADLQAQITKDVAAARQALGLLA
ncbi:MAG: riboflavin biosynthesis protein RibF [Opitutia bacterium]|nr:riboflavin biosynthesis protein RibF [Opitutales bacterium]PHX80024.1 MAG: riboflavin biosynthesis protein RibF [Opitutae bacterium]PHX80047.1 MAG: riboflavin biosynthesis protein RibF [Opitutae bacterium]